MCVGGGSKKAKINPFDLLKKMTNQKTADKQAAAGAPITSAPGGAGAPTITPPGGKTTIVENNPVVSGAQGNTAATGQFGERTTGVMGNGAAANPFFGSILDSILKITGQSSGTVKDPNAVGAGRIGQSYGASNLRIGR